MTEYVKLYNQERIEFLLAEIAKAIRENTEELRRSRNDA